MLDLLVSLVNSNDVLRKRPTCLRPPKDSQMPDLYFRISFAAA